VHLFGDERLLDHGEVVPILIVIQTEPAVGADGARGRTRKQAVPGGRNLPHGPGFSSGQDSAPTDSAFLPGDAVPSMMAIPQVEQGRGIMSAESDLLRVVLALQMGFVTKEQVVEVGALWAEDRSKPLTEILAENGSR